MEKEWFKLNPNDFSTRWWRCTEIRDSTIIPENDLNNVNAYIIIQDGNMGGNFWHICTWYKNNPNRYSQIISEPGWFLNKKLTDMNEGDTVYAINDPEIKFKVFFCIYGSREQINYCKILERI